MKLLNQTQLSKIIRKRLSNTLPEDDPLRDLRSDDIYRLIHIVWEEVAAQVRLGRRVVFDSWLSIFTKPIKRETYDSKIDNTRKMTYARRIRFKPLDRLRDESEQDLTPSEYEKVRQE